jgi:hypothetical protein
MFIYILSGGLGMWLVKQKHKGLNSYNGNNLPKINDMNSLTLRS